MTLVKKLKIKIITLQIRIIFKMLRYVIKAKEKQVIKFTSLIKYISLWGVILILKRLFIMLTKRRGVRWV